MVDIQVNSVPVSVTFRCEHCGEDIDISYGDFRQEYGEPCDWSGQRATCPSCGHENIIDDWSFD